MTITKYLHSCLLVQEGEYTVLFDPGDFSYKSGLLDTTTLKRLDAVVVTHEHPDHCYEPFIKAILNSFPEVPFITNDSAAMALRQMGAINISTTSTELFEVATVPHEAIEPFGQTPENIAVHFNRLTHPGDSHQLTESREILALPVTAPWGSMINAIRLAVNLNPKTIVPIHDAHWSDAARQNFYSRLEVFFKDLGITFIMPVDGEPFEV